MKVRVIAELTDDVLQAVVAAMATAKLEFRYPGRQIQLIMGDQNFIRVNAIKGRHCSHRFTAEVHKRRRNQQANVFARQIDARGVAEELALFAQRRTMAIRQ